LKDPRVALPAVINIIVTFSNIAGSGGKGVGGSQLLELGGVANLVGNIIGGAAQALLQVHVAAPPAKSDVSEEKETEYTGNHQPDNGHGQDGFDQG